MATAMLGDYSFRLDPENISWTFGVKTKVDYTIGGKVVQVFGTQLGPMTLSGSFGQGGFDAQEEFLARMTEMARKQGEGNNEPHRFLFPFRGWDFKVYIRAVSTPDGAMSMHVAPRVINPRWTLTLHVVEENAGLKKVATDAYIERLSRGIGWHPSAFNGPADYQAMLDAQAEWDRSNSTTMGPPTAPGSVDTGYGVAGEGAYTPSIPSGPPSAPAGDD